MMGERGRWVPKGSAELVELFGEIDVYLFDQLLRGRITPELRVLDAGCGGGRNLVYLMRAGCDVYGVDRDGERVREVRALAGRLAPDLPSENFRAESVESMSFSDGFFEAVIANALLHFAHDEEHLISMLEELWRVLAPGGLFFARLATTIGIADRVQPLGGGRFTLPDGSERLLVDEAFLLATTERLGGTLLDPIKTTNVQNLRCMTTWFVKKS
jgi:SAM-dependent methyltransferase